MPSLPSAPTDQRSLKRLMKEYAALAALETQGGCRGAHAFEAAPVDLSDLYTWDLHLYDFEEGKDVSCERPRARPWPRNLCMHAYPFARAPRRPCTR